MRAELARPDDDDVLLDQGNSVLSQVWLTVDSCS